MNWVETTVGDFCPFIYGKGLSKTKRQKGLVPVYGSNGCVDFHSKSCVNGPGIIIGRKGSVGAVHLSEVPFWPIDTSFYVEKESLEELKFTYYLLKSLGLEGMNSDSAVPGLNRENAHALPITIPENKEDREALGRWISIYDEKIELNRQTNQTLEHIAQAIFKSWFVDFEPTRAKIAAKQKGGNALAQSLAAQAVICGAITLEQLQALEEDYRGLEAQLHPLITNKFPHQLAGLDDWTPDTLQTTADLFPDALVDSELGELPKGWEVKSLSEIIEVIGGGTPKRSEESYWGGDLPWFSVKDAPSHSDVFVVDTIEKISELGMQKSSTKLLPVGTTIITARGTVGKLALVGTPMCMNQSCYGIRGLEGFGPYFNYFNLREAITTLQRNTHGAVFDTITTQTFESYSMPVAARKLVKRFEGIVTPILKKIEVNSREVTTLNKVRDALLPKLLSGELATSAIPEASHV